MLEAFYKTLAVFIIVVEGFVVVLRCNVYALVRKVLSMVLFNWTEFVIPLSLARNRVLRMVGNDFPNWQESVCILLRLFKLHFKPLLIVETLFLCPKTSVGSCCGSQAKLKSPLGLCGNDVRRQKEHVGNYLPGLFILSFTA